MVALAFIMIHVGYEFELDKTNLRQYGWDYVVAMTAAAFPWLFVVLYFVFILLPPAVWGTWEAWQEALLAGRFAAPTSAGVLFAMLAAAGLSATWPFQKAHILAIAVHDHLYLSPPAARAFMGFPSEGLHCIPRAPALGAPRP
jgi:hypothetical protein